MPKVIAGVHAGATLPESSAPIPTTPTGDALGLEWDRAGTASGSASGLPPEFPLSPVASLDSLEPKHDQMIRNPSRRLAGSSAVLRTLLLLMWTVVGIVLASAAQSEPPPEIVDAALSLLGEPGPVERTTTVLTNGLTIHHWTNRTLGSRGLVLCPTVEAPPDGVQIPASGRPEDWTVTPTNRFVAQRFQRGASLSSAFTAPQTVLFAERISGDGSLTTIGKQEIGVPTYFYVRRTDYSIWHPQVGVYFSYGLCLKLTRTLTAWSTVWTPSTPVAGGPSDLEWADGGFFMANPSLKLSLIDVNNDGLAEFVVREKTAAPSVYITSYFETFERTLTPVEGTSIAINPIHTPLDRTSIVGPGSSWTDGKLTLYQRDYRRSYYTGESTLETGSFVTPGFMGIRYSDSSGIRYGWIQWSKESVQPIQGVLGGIGQPMATGHPPGANLWVDQPPTHIVDAALPWLGEPGPVERTTTILTNGLTIHHWTNRTLGSRGLVVCPTGQIPPDVQFNPIPPDVQLDPFWARELAAGRSLESWAVTRTNLLVAQRFQRGAGLFWESNSPTRPPFTNSPPVLYAERISVDGSRKTIGEPEIGVPVYFSGTARLVYRFCLKITRTIDAWTADWTPSTPVAGGQPDRSWDDGRMGLGYKNPKPDVFLIDVNQDGLGEFVVRETTWWEFFMSLGFRAIERILTPVEGTSIAIDPIRMPLDKTSIVGPASSWMDGRVTMYRFGGSPPQTSGSFVTPGFMGIRYSDSSGIRYGWIQWSKESVQPIQCVVGGIGQPVATGRPPGTNLWVERGLDGQTRIRWIPEPGQQFERWIPGDSRGWVPYEPGGGTNSFIPDPGPPAALFRLRVPTN